MRLQLWRLGAYLLLCAAVVAGFGATDAAVREHARNNAFVESRICDHQNELRKVITDLLNKNAGPTPIPAGADSSLREAITNANTRSALFLHQALTALAPVDCVNLTKKGKP